MSATENLNINEIIPGNNDRTVFDQARLQELADSIRQHGLIQPITVRFLDDCDLYQIIAGERRWRACKLAGLTTIPATVLDADDEKAAALMLAENIARADLDPVDEANAYAVRMELYGWTVADCAERAGVSSVRVQFRLKLLRLRPDLQAMVRSGQLPLGYAQILADVGLDANRQTIALARLRDNPHPTPPWFRRIVGELLEEQSQEALFDAGAFFVAPNATETDAIAEPPHPATTRPPRCGDNLPEIIRHQIAFWSRAADQWDALGKSFKRQECQAAARALAMALDTP